MTSLYKTICRRLGIGNSNDCSVRDAIHGFISSATGTFIAKIGLELDEELVEVTISGEQATGCGRDIASSEDDSAQDSTDNEPAVKLLRVKVKTVDCETFAHGFGIRDDDTIISVNDKPAESVEMVVSMMQRILRIKKNSQLRMEIHRKERGLIILDNGGEDLFEAAGSDDIGCTENITCTLKNKSSGRYLKVKSGRIGWSTFSTTRDQKTFTLKYYQRILVPQHTPEQYVALVHKKINQPDQWIYVDNGNIMLQNAPAQNATLTTNSNYIFQMSSHNSVHAFQPVNEPGKAIGLKHGHGRHARPIVGLIGAQDSNAQFEVFNLPQP